jgi:hypothetical protein
VATVRLIYLRSDKQAILQALRAPFYLNHGEVVALDIVLEEIELGVEDLPSLVFISVNESILYPLHGSRVICVGRQDRP